MQVIDFDIFQGMAPEITWLNNCGITPPSLSAKQAVTKYLENLHLNAFTKTDYIINNLNENIKSMLAECLDVDSSDLALIHNTAEGMNQFSHGLTLNSNDEIILLDEEYPSNYYPWKHFENKNCIIKKLSVTSFETVVKNFEGLLTNKTKLAALSAVHWLSGTLLPLKEISKICKSKSITLVIDGAQGVGHVEIKPKQQGFSFMAFSAWKWLMGPSGLGVIYVDKNRIDDIKPSFIGTNSVITDEDYLPYTDQLKPDAERFNYSTPSFIDWVYFEAALKDLQEIGFDTVRQQLIARSKFLYDEIQNLGFDITHIDFDQAASAIVTFKPKERPTTELIDYLKNNRIYAALRNDKVRISAHIFNRREQLSNVIDKLSKF